uniref:Uncharacterized protein n=1 Tax=Lynx canadensis TaxID=61383 RepID=A0A667H3J4_LYNCA
AGPPLQDRAVVTSVECTIRPHSASVLQEWGPHTLLSGRPGSSDRDLSGKHSLHREAELRQASGGGGWGMPRVVARVLSFIFLIKFLEKKKVFLKSLSCIVFINSK